MWRRIESFLKPKKEGFYLNVDHIAKMNFKRKLQVFKILLLAM